MKYCGESNRLVRIITARKAWEMVKGVHKPRKSPFVGDFAHFTNTVYYFPRAIVTKYHKLGGLNNRN